METSHTFEHRMSATPPTVLNPGRHTVNAHFVLRSRWHAAPDIHKQEIRGAEALTVYTPIICTRCRAATPVSRPTSACGGCPLQRAQCPIFAEWRSGPLHSVVQTEVIGAVAQAKTIQSVRTSSLAFRSRNELALDSNVAMPRESTSVQRHAIWRARQVQNHGLGRGDMNEAGPRAHWGPNLSVPRSF